MEPNKVSEKVDVISELRMIRLLPHDIAEQWPEIRRGIEQSLPPMEIFNDVNTRMTNVLEALLSGMLKLHVFYRLFNNYPEPHGFIVTGESTSSDLVSRGLLIYAMYGYDVLTGKLFDETIALIRLYAESKDLVSIFAYTDKEELKEKIRNIGGMADYSLLIIRV